jgi:hypothetical protein
MHLGRFTISLLCCICLATTTFSQEKDSTGLSKKKDSTGFDRFNKKMEALFKKIPVPILTYSSEAGQVFGLAKFNLFTLSKKDTISNPTKLSEVVTFSTKGRINASVATELSWKENKYVAISYINYKKQPEYIFGIGNDVVRDSVEEVEYDRLKFYLAQLIRIKEKFYAGPVFDMSNYFTVKPDSNSFLIRKDVTGLNGGWSVGLGAAIAYDSRDSRYNAYKGYYVIASVIRFPSFLGSTYEFTKFELDARHFINPWLRHVIAFQATTTMTDGDVPFYELAKLGGDSKMRGYYEGAYRDLVAVDAQIEYRMPVWSIFGVTAWFGTGRVADKYANMNINGFHFSYGGGFRIRVDSKNNTNLRVDFGFGPHGIKGTYINFAEAF